MQRAPAIKPKDPYPVLFTARSAVLLMFFIPLTNQPERASLLALADSLQEQLSGLVRVLRIDEDLHSDVVQSFAITKMPAFVLVRRGVELWRQEGLSDEATLAGVIHDLLTD